MYFSQGNLPLKQDAYVIVRVWTSGINSGENVGHVSIETPNCYISLWPEGEPGGKLKQFFEERKADYMINYEADLAKEGREPEFCAALYSLKVEAIEYKFSKIKDGVNHWTLLGKGAFNESADSCSKLAYDLLKTGGIGRLIKSQFSSSSNQFSSKLSASVTPDTVAAAVRAAKLMELKSYPETVNFKKEGEKYTQSVKAWCTII